MEQFLGPDRKVRIQAFQNASKRGKAMDVMAIFQNVFPHGLSTPSDRVSSTEQRTSGLQLGSLVFRCPIAQVEIESGIDLDLETFRRIRTLVVEVRCRGCQEMHNFTIGSGALAAFRQRDRCVAKHQPAFAVTGERPASIRNRSMGGSPVEMRSVVRSRPDVSVEERLASEFAKRIRKLRWMGMEDEAQQLQCSLRDARVTDTLLAAPHGKD
jgi:hypothetical protein